jgi:hypothetical protein
MDLVTGLFDRLFRRGDKSERAIISDDFGEWIRIKNPKIAWILERIWKAFVKAKLRPYHVYSLYFAIDSELKDLTEVKAMVVTPLTRRFADVQGSLTSLFSRVFVKEVRLVREDTLLLWFFHLLAFPEKEKDGYFYNLLYPVNIHGEKLPYNIEDFLSSTISVKGKCSISRYCRVGDELVINAKCVDLDYSGFHDLVKALTYFTEPNYVSITPSYQGITVRIKSFKRFRVYPIVWDSLSKVPNYC